MPAPRKDQPTTSPIVQNLESKIDLIIQKIRTIEKNEEVIGRTLIAQREQIKKLEEKFEAGGGGTGTNAPTDLTGLRKELDELYSKKEDVAELKYVLDTINPLEYVRLDDIKSYVEEQIEKKLYRKPV